MQIPRRLQENVSDILTAEPIVRSPALREESSFLLEVGLNDGSSEAYMPIVWGGIPGQVSTFYWFDGLLAEYSWVTPTGSSYNSTCRSCL